MKKSIFISVLCGLFLFACGIPTQATGASLSPEDEIKKNKEFLEEQFNFDEFTSEEIAKEFNELGIKNIISVRVDLCEEGDPENYVGGAWKFLITDSAGSSYFVQTNGFGAYLRVQRDGPDGEYILEESYSILLPPQWWHFLPDWVQWILRYLCFGWIWM